MTQYMTIPEAALRWEIAPDAIRAGCLRHEIRGAVRFGRSWLIPESAQRLSMAENAGRKPEPRRAWDQKIRYVGWTE